MLPLDLLHYRYYRQLLQFTLKYVRTGGIFNKLWLIPTQFRYSFTYVKRARLSLLSWLSLIQCSCQYLAYGGAKTPP